mmetsp:Transcript_23710/g.42955  ORF Transcript_23710/g.42955 Transcript_23710/m.42955 type:complete len:214 (+) Transcript_23710:444-1085(+)
MYMPIVTETRTSSQGTQVIRCEVSCRPLISVTTSSSLGGTNASNSARSSLSQVSPSRMPSTTRSTRPTATEQQDVKLSILRLPVGGARARTGSAAANLLLLTMPSGRMTCARLPMDGVDNDFGGFRFPRTCRDIRRLHSVTVAKWQDGSGAPASEAKMSSTEAPLLSLPSAWSHLLGTETATACVDAVCLKSCSSGKRRMRPTSSASAVCTAS